MQGMNYIRVEDQTITIKRISKATLNQSKYIKELLQSYVDTYYLVLVSINEIMESGNFYQLDLVVKTLHVSIQNIYYQGCIKFMSSCLIETINNAFNRFAQLGACVINNYEFTSEEGPGVYFIKSTI